MSAVARQAGRKQLDDIVEWLPHALIDMLRSILADIHTDVLHSLNRNGVQPGWMCACAGGLEVISGNQTKQRLRHLTSG